MFINIIYTIKNFDILVMFENPDVLLSILVLNIINGYSGQWPS